MRIVTPAEPAATALRAAKGKTATARGYVLPANAWDGGIDSLDFAGRLTAARFKKTREHPFPSWNNL